jgi:hypothetical protein
MKASKLVAGFVLTAALFTAHTASAVECGGIVVPDSVALALINSQAAGYRQELSDRKTLVVRSVRAVSGTNCKIGAEVNVTLERRIRRDASGVISVRGDLNLNNGKLCISNAQVIGVSLSNTLGVGEAIYRRVANRVLPTNLCL